MTQWFKGDPILVEEPMIPVLQHWMCPDPDEQGEDCLGEMIFNGMSWPVNPPGYHHTCNVCGYTAVPRGGKKYPQTVFKPATKKDI